jgi:hypothetical protein
VRGDDRVGRPVLVVHDGLHERVGHADEWLAFWKKTLP